MRVVCFILALFLIIALPMSALAVDDYDYIYTGEEEEEGSEVIDEPAADPIEDPVDPVEEDNPPDEVEIIDEDPADAVSVESLEIQADTVMLMSNLPEDNDYPSGAPLMGAVYIHADTAELGEIIIYIPSEDQYKAFTYNTSGQPVNITGSTITGYVYTGNDYYVRWNSWGQAQYRTVNSSYGGTYEDLNIRDVLNTNVVFIESNEDLNPLPDDTVLSILIFSLLGGVFFCLLLKRL